MKKKREPFPPGSLAVPGLATAIVGSLLIGGLMRLAFPGATPLALTLSACIVACIYGVLLAKWVRKLEGR